MTVSRKLAAAFALSCMAQALAAQVMPAPGWCSMAHCNPQMTDFVAQTPPGITGGVYVKSSDPSNTGVATGDGCVGNGTYVACAYKQAWNALVVYDGNGNTVWGSGGLLDNNEFAGLPIMQADGSVVAGDDQHLYKFNSDGSVAWSTPTPGGVPIGLVPTPNGAIVAGTDGRQVDPCWQNNCTLSFNVNYGGKGYTSATVTLAGGSCPGATAAATVSGGAVRSIAAISQGFSCVIGPDVIIAGDGTGASASAVLSAAAPVTVYNGATGALVGSVFLYQTGDNGPFYSTSNTACVNNGSYPNRLYLLSALASDHSQGALWALDIDPTNLANPIRPAWNVTFRGPSGASPLCVGNQVYFDGAGVTPGDDVGTTVFGVQDNGSSGSFLFHVSLGPNAENITCNFALDPRPEGGFWYQIKYDPSISHRAFNTGGLIETIDVGNLLLAKGAPPATYWQAGVFTTYGTADRPYLMMPEAASPGDLGYFVMLDLVAQQIVWAVPMAGNDPDPFDTPGGDAVLVMDSEKNPVMVMTGKLTGAYFLAEGGPILSPTVQSLSLGTQTVGATSGPQSFTLTNAASATVNFSGIVASGPYAETNTCGATLAPGTGCTVTVTFSPHSAGLQSGSITVTGNSQNSPLSIPLSGSGTASTPLAKLSVNQLTFPAQAAGTVSPPQTVTLTNTGTTGLAIASIAASGATAETNNCPTSLAPGANCAIDVMLAAPLTGLCTGAITVSSNSPGGPQTVAVSATCTMPLAVESALSATSLVFNPQTIGTASSPQKVTLKNIGTQVLNIASIRASGDVTESATCGTTLAVGAQCNITVVFVPAAIGMLSAAVTVTDAAPDSPHVIAVSGVGQANPVPLVNQPLLPAAVQPGSTGLTLTVNGSGFVPGSVVNWNGSPRVTKYTSRAQVSASITMADLSAPVTGWISVVNPSPGGGSSNVVWMPVAYPSPAPLLTSTTEATGAGPAAVTAADFNLDGKLDLAVANASDNTVSILLGNGDGTFAARANYPVGMQPVAIAAGDVNHDGIPDLVVANQADNTVSVLLGRAGGVFGLAAPYATGNGPVAVAMADLNGDGTPDLAVANLADNTVSILLGNGNGTFAAHLDYAAGQSPYAIVIADFNGDGKPDLAIANNFLPGGTVTVLLNHGDGSYLPGVAYPTGDSVSLVAADFNGDGKLDLAAVNELEQTLSVYLGNGNGTFRLGPYQTTQLSPSPLALAAADMDGDGELELLVAGNSSDGFTALENYNDGAFTGLTQIGTGAGVAAMALGDFNNDGSMDAALVAPASNTVSVLLQSPSVELSSTSVNFGNVLVGGSATQAVTLTNSGSAVLKVTAVSAGNHRIFSQTNNCVTVIAPGNSCTITVKFSPTAAGTQTGTLGIADNAPGGRQTISLSGVGATFTVSIGLPQNKVIGGNPAAGNTVALSDPAPTGGWTVSLSSSNPTVAAVPASVPVAAGATTSSSFTIVTTAVSSSTPVTLAASVNESTAKAILTVNPIGVSVTLSAPSVYGGNPLPSNTLTLASRAPAGGLVFNLSSSDPALASVPASVAVAAGATSSSPFTVTSTAVASETSVTIAAGMTGVSGSLATAQLKIYPLGP